MINFFSENNFQFNKSDQTNKLLKLLLNEEGYELGDLNYIFCNDDYLLNINKQYLNHDYYTDIISFDNTVNKIVYGDIYISTDRVKDNSLTFNTTFENELARIIIHGLLHLCGYKDKSQNDKQIMTQKEDYYLALL